MVYSVSHMIRFMLIMVLHMIQKSAIWGEVTSNNRTVEASTACVNRPPYAGTNCFRAIN